MIGNRVRILLVGDGSSSITGVLHKIDKGGIIVWRECSIPEGQGTSFIPMHRVHEIVDLGRP